MKLAWNKHRIERQSDTLVLWKNFQTPFLTPSNKFLKMFMESVVNWQNFNEENKKKENLFQLLMKSP
jgi:hypothetical protein